MGVPGRRKTTGGIKLLFLAVTYDVGSLNHFSCVESPRTAPFAKLPPGVAV